MDYLHLAVFLLLAPAGILLGLRLGKHRLWGIPAATAFTLLALIIIGHRWQWASFLTPIRWAIDADIRPPLMTFSIALLFAILIPKLTARRTRIATATLMTVSLVYFGALPATLALASRPTLAHLQTRIDRNGICLQTTHYTCGPASAVTCLHQLNINAEESEIALAARTSIAYGTDPRLLANVLNAQHPEITAQHQWIENIATLKTPAIADCIIPRVGGHYIAILEVTENEITIGDPLSGKQKMSTTEFMKIWKRSAITIQRKE